jgi:hypothetical protein
MFISIQYLCFASFAAMAFALRQSGGRDRSLNGGLLPFKGARGG